MGTHDVMLAGFRRDIDGRFGFGHRALKVFLELRAGIVRDGTSSFSVVHGIGIRREGIVVVAMIVADERRVVCRCPLREQANL